MTTANQALIDYIIHIIGKETVIRIIEHAMKYKYFECPECHHKVNPKAIQCRNCKILLRARYRL